MKSAHYAKATIQIHQRSDPRRFPPPDDRSKPPDSSPSQVFSVPPLLNDFWLFSEAAHERVFPCVVRGRGPCCRRFLLARRIGLSRLAMLAPIAQSVEHLIRNEGVGSSSLPGSWYSLPLSDLIPLKPLILGRVALPRLAVQTGVDLTGKRRFGRGLAQRGDERIDGGGLFASAQGLHGRRLLVAACGELL